MDSNGPVEGGIKGPVAGVTSTGEATFCSPSCGFQCRKAAFDRAMCEADLLAKRMGPGWVAEVWENCGWHFKASKGVCGVYAVTKGSAIAGTYSISSYMANFNHTFVAHGDTPLAAVEKAVAAARKASDELQATLAPFEGVDA